MDIKDLELKDWTLTFWDAEDNIIKEEKIPDRDQRAAYKEAQAEADRMSHHEDYDTWSLIPS